MSFISMKINFIPIDYDSFDFRGKNYVKIIGRDSDGKRVCLVDSCPTYLWAILKKGLKERKIKDLMKKIEKIKLDSKGRKTKVEKVELHEKNYLGKSVKALKIFATNYKDLHDIASQMGIKEIEKRRGYDLGFVRHYIIEKKLNPLQWYEIEGEIPGFEFPGIENIDVDFSLNVDSIKEIDSKKKIEEAKQEEDFEQMKRYGSQLIRLNDEMIRESKELLEAMGIAVVQAPGEGEAEASHLARVNSDLFGVVSQDYDSLLFGAPNLIRNLTVSRRRKTYSGYMEVNPEIIELERVLNILEIDLDQLICLGILVGTDYNPKGVPGIGQKKALDLVKKYKQPVLIFKEVEERIMGLPEEDRFDWQEIFELFHKPDVFNVEIQFPKLDEERIKKILVGEHDFSMDRVEKQLEKLQKLEDKKKQKGLSDYF